MREKISNPGNFRDNVTRGHFLILKEVDPEEMVGEAYCQNCGWHWEAKINYIKPVGNGFVDYSYRTIIDFDCPFDSNKSKSDNQPILQEVASC